jgi:hypothetical protein
VGAVARVRMSGRIKMICHRRLPMTAIRVVDATNNSAGVGCGQYSEYRKHVS